MCEDTRDYIPGVPAPKVLPGQPSRPPTFSALRLDVPLGDKTISSIKQVLT